MEFIYLKDGESIIRPSDVLSLGSVQPLQTIEQKVIIYPASIEKKAVNLGFVVKSNDTINYVEHLARINDATAGQFGLYIKQEYTIAGTVSETSVVNTELIDITRNSQNTIYYSDDPSVGSTPVTIAIYDSLFSQKTDSETVSSFDIATGKFIVAGFVLKGTATAYIPAKYDTYVITGTSTRYISDTLGVSNTSRLRVAEDDSFINSTNTRIQATIGVNLPDQSVIAHQIDYISNIALDIDLVYEEVAL